MDVQRFIQRAANSTASPAQSFRTVAGIPLSAGERGDLSTRAVTRRIRFVRNPGWRGGPALIAAFAAHVWRLRRERKRIHCQQTQRHESPGICAMTVATT
jgi:hypothetical protein